MKSLRPTPLASRTLYILEATGERPRKLPGPSRTLLSVCLPALSPPQSVGCAPPCHSLDCVLSSSDPPLSSLPPCHAAFSL